VTARWFLLLILLPIVACEKKPTRVTLDIKDQTRARNLAIQAESFHHYRASAEQYRLGFEKAAEAYELAPERSIALTCAISAFFAHQTETDPERKRQINRVGLAAAQSAWRQNADEVAAYYHGVHLGISIQRRGLVAVGRLGDLESLLLQAAQAPDIDHGGPLRALGMLYLRAPQWPTGIGDLDAALKYLQRVSEEYDQYPPNFFYYAQALAEDRQWAEAKQQLDRADVVLQRGNWGGFRDIWDADIQALRQDIDRQSK